MTSLGMKEMTEIMKRNRPPKLDSGPDADHVFDPFIYNGIYYFYHYMASCYCWMVRPAREDFDGFRELPAVPEDEDYHRLLAFMPTPPLPDLPLPPRIGDLPTAICQGPLTYKGADFMWVFGEGSDDWKLATVASSGPDQVREQALSAQR